MSKPEQLTQQQIDKIMSGPNGPYVLVENAIAGRIDIDTAVEIAHNYRKKKFQRNAFIIDCVSFIILLLWFVAFVHSCVT